ncbi:hypothetical protein WA026_007917 [Henosepilachna vigintioctopunctata]|uniref:ARID domain-containing protein n=1 Tax=Henosepilachna vigintioctopunctata TaxID=420089 RepID=A0AAW1U4D8_9CUCU
MSDEPPILPVGTAVSAKYKGAFCEAKVSKVFPQIRYRVSYKEPNQGTDTLKEEHIKATGPIRVGRSVLAWHHGQKTFLEALVTRIQDQSQYTVVFDDGDITTLRRNYLCLKSGRHFNESETLDQLPLTHPEHFSNPVVGGRSRRRNRNRGDDSEGEHEEADPEMERYTNEVGRVVWGENIEKKRNRDWPPGLIMLPKNTKVLNTKEEFLIRSFKDDRFYNVPKKDVIEFTKEVGDNLEKSNTPFYLGVQKALRYLNTGELPPNWEKHCNTDRMETDADFIFSDSSDDEPCEEKDRFVAQLYKFLEEAGTPLNKTPTISGEDVDLYRLFSAVNKLGGYNKVSNHNKWKTVTGRLKLGNSQSVTNQVKQVYKKCLLSFEAFYKTLGVTMLNHTKTSKKNKGRSLIRDKDRATPINSPRPDKEEEAQEKKEEEKPAPEEKEKPKRRSDIREEKKKKEAPTISEISDSSSDNTEQPEASTSKDTGRPKRFTEVKSWAKEKKTPKAIVVEKIKTTVDKLEEPDKREEDKEKGQQTRSKTQIPKSSAQLSPDKKSESKNTPTKENKETKELRDIKEIKETKEVKDTKDNSKNQIAKTKKIDDYKDKTKRSRKRSHIESEGLTDNQSAVNINIGDKLKVYYGPSIESKITYEAKVVEIDKEGSVPLYLVHYLGWNTRYDEWIGAARVAENLSAATKAKRLKLGNSNPAISNSSVKSSTPIAAANSAVTVAKIGGKTRRNVSVTRRTSVNELPRSTTPLSSTSTSSRPKTPATPATRSATRSTKRETKRTRRISIQTDTSVHTDTESPASESEPELTRTRSGGKSDEPEIRTYKKRVPRMPVLTKAVIKAGEDDDDTEKEEEQTENVRTKRTRKVKRTSEKVPDESDEDSFSLPPKGRDFDLNQIRSELKGFSKAVPALNSSAEKDSSSDDSAKPVRMLHITAEEDEVNFEEEKELENVEKKESPASISKPGEESSSCEDIYEFKEPEPFEFEARSALTEEKGKKRLPRFYEDVDKSPSKGPIAKSPARSEQSIEVEMIRSPVKSNESEGEEDVEEAATTPKLEKEDPFDKLVESPSFNMGKVAESNKLLESPPKLSIMTEDPVALFDDPPDTADDCSRDMELSDTESQTQPIFTTRTEEVFSDAFTKSSSEQNTLDLEFSKSEDRNVDEEIQASIQRVIEQASSTDDDTRDAGLQTSLPSAIYQAKKLETNKSPSLSLELAVQSVEKDAKPSIEKPVDNPEKSAFGMLKRLSPVPLIVEKESSSLLETISRQPQVAACSSPLKIEDDKEFNEIAPSVLTNVEAISCVIAENLVEDSIPKEEKLEELKEEEVIVTEEDDESSKLNETKMAHLETMENSPDGMPVTAETEEMDAQVEENDLDTSPILSEPKKRRKVISRPFIESESDSSDSDNLVIARSDDDSQTNSIVDNEKDLKENWDSNISVSRLSMEEAKIINEERNFNFEKMPDTDVKKNDQDDINDAKSVSDQMDIEEEDVKEEEPDSHLHEMLLCEETIPRSPAPIAETTEVEEPVRRSKSALEMPFASVPGSSNNKSMLLNPEPVKLHQPTPLIVPADVNSRETSGAVITSSPSTPESTISNLSPRDTNCGLSPDSRYIDNPNTCDNVYSQKMEESHQMSYSEDDSQMACDPPKKDREDSTANHSGRKRRRSYRGNESSSSKRGRRVTNRSRHNSDSEDDTSDHSIINSNIQSRVPYKRGSRSERPLKYDFRANLDGITDSNQRINLILQKISDLKKVYVDVKAELADIERRRKKIRRRQREGGKNMKFL